MFGGGILLGIQDYVDDLVENCIEQEATKNHQVEIHTVTMKLSFDEELQFIKEWIAKPNIVEDYIETTTN